MLGTYPQFRGRGIGGRLPDVAEMRRREAGLSGLSIIASDANTGAIRLYERKGYRRKAERPMIKEGCRTPAGTGFCWRGICEGL